MVGDQPVEGPNIVHLHTDKQLKGPKLDLALEYLGQQDHQPRYLIRFDDDDVIAPDILRRVSRLEFDCVADRYHAYYDLTTGKTCLSKNHWMANTVIHKYEHALFGNEENPHPLITRDHSIDWHQYYDGKKVVYTTKYNPIYIRVLTPECHSYRSGPELASRPTLDEFHQMIERHGSWGWHFLPTLNEELERLDDAWAELTAILHPRRARVASLAQRFSLLKKRTRVSTHIQRPSTRPSFRWGLPRFISGLLP